MPVVEGESKITLTNERKIASVNETKIGLVAELNFKPSARLSRALKQNISCPVAREKKLFQYRVVLNIYLKNPYIGKRWQPGNLATVSANPHKY